MRDFGRYKHLILCGLMILYLFVCVPAGAQAIRGDANVDGCVDLGDAVAICRYVSELAVESFDPALADANGDARVSIEDALLIAHSTINASITIPPLQPAPTPLYPANWNELQKLFSALSLQQKEKLFKNGFVVLDSAMEDSLAGAYTSLLQRGNIPVFVSADALLHLYHITYTDMLSRAELSYLAPRLGQFYDLLQVTLQAEYEALMEDSFFKEAAGELLIFASVGLALFHGSDIIALPAELSDKVTTLLAEIRSFSKQKISGAPDYSQFKPRGHYADDPLLQAYFQALKWMQSCRWQPAGDDLLQAALLADIFAADSDIRAGWQQMELFYRQLSGTAEVPTPELLRDVLLALFPEQYPALGCQVLSLGGVLPQAQSALRQDARFSGEPIRLVNEPRWLYLEALEQTLHPGVTNRYLPGGADIAATVLGSGSARQTLANEQRLFSTLEGRLDTLQQGYSQLPTELWQANLYNSWHFLLRQLSVTPPPEAPAFMHTSAWELEKLNTQLASWAELHSDHINLTEVPIAQPPPTEPPITPALPSTSAPTGFPITPIPTAVPTPAPGTVWLEPAAQNLTMGEAGETRIYLNTGEHNVASIGLEMLYNAGILRFLNVSKTVAAGLDPIVNGSNPGQIIVAAFCTTGVGPSPALQLFTIHWQTLAEGTSQVIVNVDTLTDAKYNTVGTLQGIGGVISISLPASTGTPAPVRTPTPTPVSTPFAGLGDVNGDNIVNIIDALMVAQYAVGLPVTLNLWAANVNGDQVINIIDALMIAQYSVGLNPIFIPGPSPMATPVPTPTPLPCFVEPYPAFYTQLKTLSLQAKALLDNEEFGLGDLPHDLKFQKIANWAGEFAVYAQKLAAGGELTAAENRALLQDAGEIGTFFANVGFPEEERARTLVISDIYTYADRVLHVAVGRLHPVIILFPHDSADPRPLAAVGYGLSYYEILQQDSIRWDDAQWEVELDAHNPFRPLWADEFVGY